MNFETFGTAPLVIVAISLFAAGVNGALGYGFSSLTVPIGLMFYSSRILNPALVLVEVIMNAYLLFLNRGGIRSVWEKTIPILIGVAPAVGIGGLLLSLVQPSWIKLGTYAILLPLILIQAGGVRWLLPKKRRIGVSFGAGVGLLYSLTTISGPPMALFFNNEGLVKHEFRAALSIIRLFESTVTAIVYLSIGLISYESLGISRLILPCVIIGVPLGSLVIGRLPAETFRRVCMSFDVWLVGFGLSKALNELGILTGIMAYSIMAAACLLDLFLLQKYFWPNRLSARPK